MTIHVHKSTIADYYNKYILVDPNRNVAVYVGESNFTEFAQDLIDGGGWTVDCTVGEYICTLDELHDKYPELLI